ncbi:MAG: hypothetical protein LKJ78_08180 [Serratia liquefaciens]|jgi:hypothetical protein|uniref:hypothetical protein n=1 Tax=Serratia proteamaculans TaxID=28151 RepID=UPI002182D19F|nr:hypothetical protein [Serratia proteamaculans]MCH4196485.1 hypothetical protein [Serratia liquefaciens]MCH4230802.1 hypothetical protein [Serratia liquefaciens]MCH4262504.1 hypothetical protein [Serratia liquefaciens]MCI1214625.1 hypothetical protein [Serratia liquefaciens]MCI1235979.1 hypothetical protein [Serratia liquefaciens]
MISQVQFNELEKRVEALELALVAMQRKGDVPEGMAPLTTLAAEMGLSTSKAEELARNCGVMIVKQGNGYIVHAAKFREAALLVIRGAKRKYGSKYWFHPLIGKFIMIKGAQA